MDKFGKLFIRAGVVYLGVGALLGLHMAFFEHNRLEIRYVHTHIMLIGFMANIIYGVSYHILPRFNAKPVPHPGWIPIHFWLANIGLWGLVIFYAIGGFWDAGFKRVMFGVSGLVEGIAIFLFVFNILPVLRDDAEPEIKPVAAPVPSSAPPPPPAPEVRINPSMKIAEILDKWPHLEVILEEEGLGDVSNLAVRQSVAKMITLKMAATRAGKDLFALIARLEGKRLVNADDAPAEKPAAPAHPPGYLPAGAQIARGGLANAKTQVGNLLEVYPETRTVFESHYGAACFTCPGQKTETVEQTAMMHGLPAQQIVDEINAIIEKAMK